MEFVKELSSSEAKYKYVGLTKAAREEFPPKDIKFDVLFKGKKYKLGVNNRNCIMITQLYDKHEFVAGQVIRITTQGDTTNITINEG